MYWFDWNDARLAKIDANGVSREAFEETVNAPDDILRSNSSGRPIAVAWQGDRWLYCVFELAAPTVVTPVTAFYVRDSR